MMTLTMTLVTLFLAPAFALLALGALLVPVLVARIVRAAEAPAADELPRDGWALALLEALDADEEADALADGWYVVEPRRGAYQRQPRRMARAVQRSRQNWAVSWALPRTKAPQELARNRKYAEPGEPTNLARNRNPAESHENPELARAA